MADNIIIQATTTCQTEKSVYALINGGFIAERAEIHYNKWTGLPTIEEVDKYPLILTGTISQLPITIKIYCVTAGYSGSGPYTLAHILKYAGFIFDEEDIFTKRCCDSNGVIALTYTK